MNWLRRLGSAVKAAAMSFGSTWYGASGRGWSWSTRNDLDYEGTVGDGRNNSIVFATLGWVGRKFPDGYLALRQPAVGNAKPVDIDRHDMLTLLQRPNGFYSGSTMLVAAAKDWMISGDAYIFKVRNDLGGPIQLWYVPSFLVEPYSNDSKVFITAYRYTPTGSQYRDWDPKDVIHIRNGIDPQNVRKGCSPMQAIVREVYSDEEAALWTAAVLHNDGALGVVISADGDAVIGPDEAPQIKQTFRDTFGGSHRGETMVVSSKIKIDRLSVDPEKMNLASLRQIPEERITAALGVPAVVVGLGAGLDRATYSNLAALREAAVEDTLLPMYRVFAEELKAQLMGDFEANVDAFELYYNTEGIRELQPDADKLVEREALALKSGGQTIDEFRAATGRDPLPNGAGNVLLIPAAVNPTPIDQLIAPPLPQPEPIPPTPPGPPAPGDGQNNPATAGFGGDDLEIKALGVVTAITGIRGNLLDGEARRIATRLAAQQRAAVGILDDVRKAIDDDGTARKFNAGPTDDRIRALLATDFEASIRTDLERLHVRAASAVHEVVTEWAGVDIPIEARRQAYLREAAARVSHINTTTLRALADTIRASNFADESLEELTARVRGLAVFSATRARMIARTELAIATNKASVAAFEDSGIVTHVRVHDGTGHDDICSGLAGRVFTLVDAARLPQIAHPNCVRSFEPLTRHPDEQHRNGNGHVKRGELART